RSIQRDRSAHRCGDRVEPHARVAGRTRFRDDRVCERATDCEPRTWCEPAWWMRESRAPMCWAHVETLHLADVLIERPHPDAARGRIVDPCHEQRARRR